MIVTTRGRYAVMAILDIADHDQYVPVSLADIASRQNIALSYLEQIFMKLKNSDIVTSVRGPGGGYLLSRPAVNITIDQIIDAVEEDIDATRCGNDKNKGCMPGNIKCKGHDLWEELGSTVRDYFANISVTDVLKNNVKKRDK